MKQPAILLCQQFLPFFKRLIPPALLDRPTAATRAENLLAASFISLLVLPGYGVFYHVLGDDICARACYMASAAALAAPLLLRLTGSIGLAREILVGAIYILLVTLTYRLDGIDGPTVIWFAVCPLLATGAGGWRPGLIWSIVSLLTVVAMYAADVMDLLPPPVIADLRLLGAVSVVTFVVALAIFLLLYENATSGAIVRLDQALQLIQELARRDELTGIYNRRELLRVAQDESANLTRDGGMLSLCLIDVDHFKQINDRYGHSVGDKVLKRVAQRIQEQIRSGDCFGRYGGEEFLLLLVGCNDAAARVFAERVRASVAQMSLPELTDGHQLTISAGVVQYRDGETMEHALTRADKALYQAKHEGRNRVILA